MKPLGTLTNQELLPSPHADHGPELERIARETPDRRFIDLERHNRICARLTIELSRANTRYETRNKALWQCVGYGVTLLVLVWMLFDIIDPVTELRLIWGPTSIATGELGYSGEGEAEEPSGAVNTFDVGVYKFKDTEGDEYECVRKSIDLRIASKVEVEYLPNVPTINRVKGDGCQTPWRWIVRVFGHGIWLWVPLLFCAASLWLAVSTVP